MASVDRKLWYRNVYLKSAHWEDLRLRKLVEQKGKCQRCMGEAWNNDVHHLRYKNIHDVQLEDLVVVCRRCHKLVHFALETCPSIKKVTPTRTWPYTKMKIRRVRKGRVDPESMAAKTAIKTARLRCFSSGKLKPMRYVISNRFLNDVIEGLEVTDEVLVNRITLPYKEWLLRKSLRPVP